jgi:uncharacterized protein YkwD
MKPRYLVLTLVLVLSALLLGALPATSVAMVQLNTYEQQLVKQINRECAAHNLPKLHVQAKLVASAQDHSADMGSNKYFEHDSLAGESWSSRIMRHGYKREGFRVWKAGENIAWGAGLYSSPVYIVDCWMSSPLHRAVLMSRDFRDIGVGAVSTEGYGSIDGMVWFFTVDLGRRSK